MPKKTIPVFFVTAAFAAALSADEIVLQNGLKGYNGCVDTYLHITGNGASVPFQYLNDNFHAGATIETAGSPNSCGFPAYARALYKFDLSPITAPAGAVKKATFSTYFIDGSKGKEKRFAYRITKDWAVTQTTWLHAKSGELWDSQSPDTMKQGGAYTPDGGAAGPYASKEQWEHFDVTAIVRYFLDNPDKNFGFLCVDDEADGHTQRIYASSDFTDNTSLRPKLAIEYPAAVSYYSQAESRGIIDLRITGSMVRFSLPGGTGRAVVRNAKGQVILNMAGGPGGWREFPLDGFHSGVYFLTVLKGNTGRTVRFAVTK